MIADGKRGDIDVTARAYAGALLGGSDSPFGHIAGLGADLVTVNPLMGADAVEPFVRRRVMPAAACWCSCARPTPVPRTSRT